MEVRREKCIRFWMLRLLCFSLLSLLFLQCDGRRTMLLSKDISYPNNPKIKHLQILDVAKNLNMVMDVTMKDSSDPQPYVSSPLTLPPYDFLSPTPLPDNSPPLCVYPPPQSPSTTIPSPFGLSPTPPSPSSTPSPFDFSPTPTSPSPYGFSPTPPSSPSSSPIEPIFSPPLGPIETTPPLSSITPSPPYVLPEPPTSIPISPPYYEPSPPSGLDNPSPPEYVPSPIGFSHGPPPVFQPPVVFPGLSPPPTIGAGGGGERVWCVAKPSVPDPILQEAMNYACGSGADCGPIQPNGRCFQPNSPLAHASYAFNSYWQRTKAAGGTCEFGGIAILVTVNPGSQGCHFVGN